LVIGVSVDVYTEFSDMDTYVDIDIVIYK